jgi:GxxExxY protein
LTDNEISKEVVDAAYRIHSALGPGLLESVYRRTLAWELEHRGLNVTREMEVPVVYQGVRIDSAFRADLVVGAQLIVEVKSIEFILPIHKKQLLTYLRLANLRLGLLINFHTMLIKDGITRIANGLPS